MVGWEPAEMVRRFLLKLLVNALALWVADWLLAGFAVSGGVWGYLVAGLALAVLNTFLRPILKLLSLPLMLITLGLFSVVINAGILLLAAHWLGSITIATPLTLLWATLIITAVNIVLEPRRHE